jgi:hypothetical protein
VQKVEGNESIRDLPVVQDLLHEAYRYRVNPSSVKNIRSTPRTGHQFNPEQSHASITLSDDKLTVCPSLDRLLKQNKPSTDTLCARVRAALM